MTFIKQQQTSKVHSTALTVFDINRIKQNTCNVNYKRSNVRERVKSSYVLLPCGLDMDHRKSCDNMLRYANVIPRILLCISIYTWRWHTFLSVI